MAPKFQHVEIVREDGIAWTYLNRPEKRNAMNPQLHIEMNQALDYLEADDETKVVVISGAGGNFSAGQDLKEYFRALDGDPAEGKRIWLAANNWQWNRLYMFNKPTIAMVHGYCVGGAFTHLLATDFVMTAEDATFSLSEVNWGILPGGMVSKALVDTVLHRHALYYACLGDPFDGKEAQRIGIANFAIPASDLKDETAKLAMRLMEKSPAALRATKQAIRQVRQMSMSQAEDYLQEKKNAIRAKDPDHSYESGISQFLDDKSYKPVYGAFKRQN
ncbi:MAG: p-hydroxycinnamoyl CoA hydratase/lyase [Rhizobiaceae bacterium]|nr:p-hydroxycinnamoyl CoA hydratase/lyase [Rhizobiaceae bacterium]